MEFHRRFLAIILLLVAYSFFIPGTLTAQTEESVYISKRVEDSQGNLISHSIPDVMFTAFLNGEQDSILIENAPRWDGGDTNFNTTNSIVGVEMQNFIHFSVPDTLHLRFTDRILGERATFIQPIDTIPWTDPNPFSNITLKSVDLPQRPQNVSFTYNKQTGERTISWDKKSGLTYTVYRRDRNEDIYDGRDRNLYVRIASDLNAGSYTDDTNPDKQFAYIVYAENQNGVKSVHSKEVGHREADISGLTVVRTKPKNVTIAWNSYKPLVDNLGGFNIYRKKKGTEYGSTPHEFTPPDTSYTDTRLEPGQTYYYKVVPRNYNREELGKPMEVKVTTETASDTYMTYANLKMAVVLYANAPANAPAVDPNAPNGVYKMSNGEIQDIKFLIGRVREYMWRNTKMNLNLEVDYITFEEYKKLTDTYYKSTRTTGKHLTEDRGVVRTQYDIVFRLTPTTGGFWSWGATYNLGLKGPKRRTGFEQIRWPYRDFVIGGFERYPNVYSEIDYQEVGNNLIWTFTHEAQHSLDGIYKYNNGHTEMGHGDFPQLYAVENIENSNINCCYPGFPAHYSKRFGKRFSFQSQMMRDFRHYKDLESDWGDLYQTKDVDGDKIPDHDPRVPVDERSFGSSVNQADTDGDGYTDKQEAIDGIFEYSTTDPHKIDTDGDGKSDGKDYYPRYPVDRRIKTTGDGFVPTIDGQISEWPAHAMVNDTVSKVEGDQAFAPEVSMAYSNDSLYVMLDIPIRAVPKIRWDFDANGFRFGPGNTTMKVDVNNGNLETLETYDASPDSRDYDEKVNDKKKGVGNGFWDNSNKYLEKFNRPIYTKSQINLAVQSTEPGYHIEIAIPKSERSNLALNENEEIGFHIDYSDVKNLGLEARTFDWWDYAYVHLSGLKATDVPTNNTVVQKFQLKKNYPNPFNPSTNIEYTLPQSGSVELAVYNMLGRRVATIVNEKQSAGRHKVKFNAENLSSGVYLYRLKTNQYSRTRKMLLLK